MSTTTGLSNIKREFTVRGIVYKPEITVSKIKRVDSHARTVKESPLSYQPQKISKKPPAQKDK